MDRVTWSAVNTLRSRQNGRHFTDDNLKCIYLNGNVWISLKISLKFVPKVRINKIPALVQIMAWRRPDDKPLFEPMMVSLLTHICVTRPSDTYMCASKLGHYCFRWWLAACSAPSHHLNQIWIIISTRGNRFQWYVDRMIQKWVWKCRLKDGGYIVSVSNIIRPATEK